MSVKKEVHEACIAHVKEKLKRAADALADLQQQLEHDSRSTAGDRHETGRAMLHIEQEQLSKRLYELNLQLSALTKLSLAENGDAISEGHLIETTMGYYYLSLGLGKLRISEKDVNVISCHSPIGRLLLGRRQGDEIYFNNKVMSILSVK